MILVAGTVDVDPEQRAAALEAGRPNMEATRAEEGCLDYVWSADPLVPGRICVFERWTGSEALAAHFAGPHYRAMRDTIASHGLRAADVAKYEPGRSGPVYDSRGVPRADFFGEDASGPPGPERAE